MRWLLVFAFVAGCSKKQEKVPTCAEVTDHVLALVQRAYPGHGDMGGRGNRQREIEACEARKLPAAERRCMLAAKSMDAVAACRKPSVQDPPQPAPTVPPVPTRTPAGSSAP